MGASRLVPRFPDEATICTCREHFLAICDVTFQSCVSCFVLSGLRGRAIFKESHELRPNVRLGGFSFGVYI